MPCCNARAWAVSTSAGVARNQLIHTPPVASSPVNLGDGPPREPCAPRQRKISTWPAPTAPNVGGVPQSQSFRQPSFSNQSKLAVMSETFRIGVRLETFMINPQRRYQSGYGLIRGDREINS